jgi:hypothetical protein
MLHLYLEFASPGPHYRESPARLKPRGQHLPKALAKQGERNGQVTLAAGYFARRVIFDRWTGAYASVQIGARRLIHQDQCSAD